MNAQKQQVRDAIRLDAWRSVFEKTNRILSEQRVTVRVAEDVPSGMDKVPGWSNGLEVFLNGPLVQKMLDKSDPTTAVLRLKGLNYHELCHVLYTPRIHEDYPRRVLKRMESEGDHNWWYAFNALEDQRIETWFTATYSASRRYFEATILEWIIKNGNTESALLLYGRKYLDPKIRVRAGKAFATKHGKDLYAEFQTVIDEYITLVMPADSMKAYTLLVRYHELLTRMMKQQAGTSLPVLVHNDNGAHDPDCVGNHGSAGASVARVGKNPAAEQRKARDKAMPMIDDSLDADAEQEQADAGGNGQPEGQDGPEDGDGQGQGDGDAEGAGADGAGADDGGQSDAGDDGPEGESDAGGGQGGGGAGGSDDGVDDPWKPSDEKSLAEQMEDLVDTAHEQLDRTLEDERLQEDVESTLDAVKAAEQNGKMNAPGQVGRFNVVPTDAEANLAARKVKDTLQRIRQEAEPETLRRQVQGRVDMRRYISRDRHEVDIFTRWDAGNEEETGVEACILVDASGSMMSRAVEASKATWALKRAFDRLDIRTTVLSYDTDFKVIYQPGDKAHATNVSVIQDGGSTDPSDALRAARLILVKSQMPNKVLVTVTDGQWHGSDDHYKPLMRSLEKAGVTSMLLGLDEAVVRYGKHHHHEAHDLKSVKDLPKAALKLVARLMQNRIS
jgi:Mg-chelatase subunit ChlD